MSTQLPDSSQAQRETQQIHSEAQQIHTDRVNYAAPSIEKSNRLVEVTGVVKVTGIR